MIVTLESGSTVEIATVTQYRHLIWAYGACSGMHVFGDKDCSVCGLYVLEPSGNWRRMTGGEKAWLKHEMTQDDWMHYA